MPPTPQSNVEKYLSVIAGHGGEIPSEPTSRVEYFLNEIIKNGGIGGKLKPEIVSSLPAIGESGVLYLIRKQGASGNNVYDEYIWIEDDSKYELLGQTDFDIDLSEYVKSTRKVGGKPLSADVGISVNGTDPIQVTDNGTASSVIFDISLKDSGVTAGSKGDTTNQTPAFGGTFKVLSAAVDAKGRLTSLAEHTVKVPDTEATQSAKGLMSASDKTKLDTLVDDTLSATGKAGDAKVTGDNVALLKELIQGIDAPIYRKASGNPATFSDADAANVKTLSVMITPKQSGSGDPSPDNIRPISGASSISVTRRNGKNLFDSSFLLRANGWSVDASSVYSGRVGALAPLFGAGIGYPVGFSFKPNTRYTFSADVKVTPDTPNTNVLLVQFFYTDGTRSDVLRVNATEFTHFSGTSTSGKDISYLSVSFANAGTAHIKNIQLEESTTETAYEPYQGQTVTVQLTDGSNPLTVYGGTLEVTTGALSVTWANIASYSGETLPGRWISDRDVYASGATPTTGAQVVYELAAPVTYQLTPQQLATLRGYNAVSTVAASVSVTYKADTELSLQGGAV